MGALNTKRKTRAGKSTRRIVILGKTGTGKSSLANTIFGEKLFKTANSPNSVTKECQAETRNVKGRSITLIDTPGFFVTDKSEEELRREIVRCITECAPELHAFLIVLKVEKFTEHEQAVITEINKRFSDEVLKYATVVFTHGDQLDEGQTIKNFVDQSQPLCDLVKKCGDRCHVIDNKYWNKKKKGKHRNNKFQVKELLNTIDTMIEANKGSCYTNEMLQAVEEKIQQEEEQIRESAGNMSEEEIREQAKARVYDECLIRLAGVGTGALLGAFFCVVGMVGAVLKHGGEIVKIAAAAVVGAAAAGGAAVAEGAAAAGGAAASAAGAAAVTGGAAGGGAAAGGTAAVVGGAVVGAVIGGFTGYHAAEGADTPWEAAERAAEAVRGGATLLVDKSKGFLENIFTISPKKLE